MQNERQQNNSRYESEKSDDMLKNAELCDDISKWSTSDRESIYWKKQGLSIAKSFMGKIIPDYVISMLKCQKYY